jgi:hypothetical protein
VVEDRQPVVEREHERVAVGDEELLDARAREPRRLLQIRERLVEVADPEALVPVHVAVGAVVVRAADRRLEDEGVVLGGRAEDAAFVAHRG